MVRSGADKAKAWISGRPDAIKQSIGKAMTFKNLVKVGTGALLGGAAAEEMEGDDAPESDAPKSVPGVKLVTGAEIVRKPMSTSTSRAGIVKGSNRWADNREDRGMKHYIDLEDAEDELP